MKRSRAPAASPHDRLGDTHNFGRSVRLGKSRIRKPRTLLWEQLLLSAQSPLRELLASRAAEDALGAHAFDFLPDLKFFSTDAAGGGEVQRIELSPLPKLSAERKRLLADITGRALALFSWLGVSDLHWENLVLGIAARERLIFAPLDVEMILADLSLPTETKLLPDADPELAAMCQHACGVRRVLPYLGKPLTAEHLVIVASAYARMLRFLDRHAASIAGVFQTLPQLRKAPIRVLLRGTDEYVRTLADPAAPLWPPLLAAETEQLARGDIPYFFQLYGRSGIHYYGDETLTQLRTLPQKGDVPQLDPLLDLARLAKAPTRVKLREDGLFAVIGAFDHPNNVGQHQTEHLAITFTPRKLVVRLEDGEELESRRNLSAFVSSVYQPCHCGEVRSVFVPRVTRCDAP